MDADQKELMYFLLISAAFIVGITLWLEFDVWLDLGVTKINLATKELIATIAIASFAYIWARFVSKGVKK